MAANVRIRTPLAPVSHAWSDPAEPDAGGDQSGSQCGGRHDVAGHWLRVATLDRLVL